MSVLARAPDDVFYFGPPGRRLYGSLHESQTYAQREFGVVVCYPFGQEYIRAHRACRHLALRLAHAGFPVLRFDYSGTGDSGGEGADATLETWRADIGVAIDMLRSRTGVEQVCLAGLRLGASLALEMSALRDDVRGLVLWEPIVSGEQYIAELTELHREVLWRFFDDAHRIAARAASEYTGFPIGDRLRAELGELDLLAAPARADHVLIVESHDLPEIARLRDRMRSAGCDVTHESIPSFTVWREDIDKGLVPDEVLRGIVAWATEVLP